MNALASYLLYLFTLVIIVWITLATHLLSKKKKFILGILLQRRLFGAERKRRFFIADRCRPLAVASFQSGTYDSFMGFLNK